MGPEAGYIKLFRSLTEWEWYDDTNAVRVWIHLLLKANHKDKRWHGRTIKRGQIVTSNANLADELGLSIQQIRRAISNLETSGEITRNTTNKFTLINVEKYTFYQDGQQANNTQDNKQKTNKQQTKNKQTTTTKEYKELKNEKNIYTAQARRKSSLSFEEQLDEIIQGETE